MKDREFFDSVAEKWDSICCNPKEKVEYVIKKAEFKKGEDILDVGSGTGILVPYLEDAIGEKGSITAIDISKNMIEVSKRKNKYNNLSFKVEDFLEYDTDKKYDYVVAYSCYPHFKNKEKFFKKAYGILKQKGKIVIAHIESKELINARHNKIEDKIHSDALLDVNITAKSAENSGFNTAYKEDNEKFYIYIGIK